MTFSEVVELIRVEAGVELEAVGFFEGGEVGAADVRGGDGVRYVLKWWEDDGAAGRRAAVLVERLRRRGYPIPRFVLADQFGDVTVMLQEFVGGETSDSVTDAVVERLLALNALQSGAADTNGASWTSYVADSLVNGCNGYCLHQPLRDYDGRTRSLLRSVAATGRALSELPSGDVVHLDFHHRNVLVSDNDVRAVIDWEGCRTGDAAFDLVTLTFGLSVARVSAQARARVWGEVCRRTDMNTRQAYAAHMALRQVDWSIRHRTAADVDHWLEVAAEYVAV